MNDLLKLLRNVPCGFCRGKVIGANAATCGLCAAFVDASAISDIHGADKKACDDHAKHKADCHNCGIITAQAARVAFNMKRAEEAERERDAAHAEIDRLARTVDRKDEQMAELQEHAQKAEQERDEARGHLEAANKARARMRERNAELEAALRFCDPRNATARYDRIADDFHRETGLWAPGRDAPAAMGLPESLREEADKRWRPFVDAWHERWFDAALSAPAQPATAAKATAPQWTSMGLLRVSAKRPDVKIGDPWDMAEIDCPCGSGLHHDQSDEDENLNPRRCMAFCTWCGFAAVWKAETDTATVTSLPHSGGSEARAARPSPAARVVVDPDHHVFVADPPPSPVMPSPAAREVTQFDSTIFMCRTCDRATRGWTDGRFEDAGWSRIENIDGPDAICPHCQEDDTTLEDLREDYPNARVAPLKDNAVISSNHKPVERVWAHDLSRRGGEWLGAARSWLQHKRTTKGIYGDQITWGDDNARFDLSAASIEELAAEVAAAAFNEQGNLWKQVEDLRSLLLRAQLGLDAAREGK